MNVKHRLVRTLGTAAVGLFLVAGVAFGANAIGQAPGRSIDTTLTTSDDTGSPATIQMAEPTETAEPAETAEPRETAEPTEIADDHGGQGLDAVETAEPTESPDDHSDGSNHDDSGHDDSGHDGGGQG